MYTRDELNLVGTCIDLAIKAGGAGAAKTLLPLFEKTEQNAKDIDSGSAFKNGWTNGRCNWCGEPKKEEAA